MKLTELDPRTKKNLLKVALKWGSVIAASVGGWELATHDKPQPPDVEYIADIVLEELAKPAPAPMALPEPEINQEDTRRNQEESGEVEGISGNIEEVPEPVLPRISIQERQELVPPIHLYDVDLSPGALLYRGEDPNEAVINREAVEKLFEQILEETPDELHSFVDSLRLIYGEDGSVVGAMFMALGNGLGSDFFQAIGFEDQDILLDVDGAAIEGPETFWSLFMNYLSGEAVEVDVKIRRQGELRDLRYIF